MLNKKTEAKPLAAEFLYLSIDKNLFYRIILLCSLDVQIT